MTLHHRMACVSVYRRKDTCKITTLDWISYLTNNASLNFTNENWSSIHNAIFDVARYGSNHLLVSKNWSRETSFIIH